jgi:hypothetical protein
MSEAEATKSPSASTSQRGGTTRLIVRVVLFVILALCLAAFAYDYLYARPQSEAALERIRLLDEEKLKFAESTFDTDVQQAIGFAPERESPTSNTALEWYRWQGGLPFRRYELWVLYHQDDDGKWVQMSHGLNTPPEDFTSPTPSFQQGGRPQPSVGPEPPPQRRQRPESESGTPASADDGRADQNRTPS